MTCLRSAQRLSSRSALVCAALTAAALTPGSAASAHTDGRPFDWPLQPRPAVVTPYDPPPERWLPGHRGVDLDASSDPSHTVVAAGDGVVVFAGAVAGRPVVSIDHAGGLRTTYEPVDATVSVGTRLRRGQPIGVLEAGHEGCVAAWCLHWGARRGRDYLDPTALVDRDVVVLKPLIDLG
ncbi:MULTISPECIES: M23 family metallopeptidase [Nocardiaceae]|uniref:Murein DD-endopeptidase MepM/ murein hydrolase activator NlpD n=1 Tax=Rhodococcoides corynebacterioides TaxID=53972 RepID=A0ABS2KST0_9NOCA|nr:MULTISPECIES: peptidoglycan DD-metalloendopeptidase family protein [Rhodococcus]MBM7414948.1 murein DD-endopeptidase MepM/ murein hydrolase activator NlpD [Rhodococcus corynebacterioides]MBP1117410.1 murein DD-endopeptidase MepM/ murein hydrolase activator NlpD [Rhodococcus sp. PvP016]